MNIKRIFTMLFKDIKENYIVILIMLCIPVFAVLLPNINFGQNKKIYIIGSDTKNYVERLEKNKFSVYDVNDINEANDSLKNNKIFAYINLSDMEVVTKSDDYKSLLQVKNALSEQSDEIVKIENREVSKITFHTFLCMILLVLLMLLGIPIVFLSDYNNDIYNYLSMTPLKKSEYLLSKLIFAFISTLLSVALYILVVCKYEVNMRSFLIILVSYALTATFVAGIVTAFFRSIDKYILVFFPVFILVIVFMIIGLNEPILYEIPWLKCMDNLLIKNSLDITSVLLINSVNFALGILYLIIKRFRDEQSYKIKN